MKITESQSDFSQYDYVLDAIDTVTGKLALIAQAKAANVPIISCMGTGNKLDAADFEVADISKTSGCALARHATPQVRNTEKLPCRSDDIFHLFLADLSFRSISHPDVYEFAQWTDVFSEHPAGLS